MEVDSDLKTPAEYSSSESDFDGFDDVNANLDEKLTFLNQFIFTESQKHPLPSETSIISALLHPLEEITEVSSTEDRINLVDQSLQANLKENYGSSDRLSENSYDDSSDHCSSVEFDSSEHNFGEVCHKATM